MVEQWGKMLADGTNNTKVTFAIVYNNNYYVFLTSTPSTQAYTLYCNNYSHNDYFTFGRYGGDSSGNVTLWQTKGY